jgi:simple sugar transport system permease protein
MKSSRSIAMQAGLLAAPVLLALLITAVLVLSVGVNPLDVVDRVWQGAFRNPASFAAVLNFFIPLTLAALGLVITFTAGLWNIGVEGQMIVGAICASWVARTFSLPGPALIVVELSAAMLGGALWGLLIGVLKTRLGVNEIFGGVALNSLLTVYTIYLISGPWQPLVGSSAQGTDPFPAEALLPPISGEFPVSLLALLIVFASAVAVWAVLRGTRWGLELKATGKNARSALLLGVATERSTWSAFMACGLLAGIAGAHRVLFTYGALRPLSSGGIGFLGLLVCLLVSNRGAWVPLVTFVFSVILGGSTRLQISLQLDQSLAGVLQGIMVLSVLLFNGLRMRLGLGVTTDQATDDEAVVPRPTETSHE